MFRCIINVSIPLADHWCIYFSRAKILSHVTLFLSPWKGLLPGIWANQCLEPMRQWWKTWGHGSWLQKLLLSMMHYVHWNEIKRSTVNYGDLQFSSRREDWRSQTPELKHLKTKGTISFVKHCLFHLIRSCHEKKEMMVPKPWRVLRNYHCTSIQIKRWWIELVKFVSLWSYIINLCVTNYFFLGNPSFDPGYLLKTSNATVEIPSLEHNHEALYNVVFRVCRRQAHPPLGGRGHLPLSTGENEGAQQTRANGPTSFAHLSKVRDEKRL